MTSGGSMTQNIAAYFPACRSAATAVNRCRTNIFTLSMTKYSVRSVWTIISERTRMTMKSDVREKMHKILDLVLDINESGKANTFMSFSGHVNGINVSAHIPKWELNSNPDIRDEVYIDVPDEAGYMRTTLDTVIENLERVMGG